MANQSENLETPPLYRRIQTSNLTKLPMYYRSGTDGCCCVCAQQTLRFHSLGGSTFLPEMTSRPPFWNHWNQHQAPMRIYVKNNSVKFHPNPIWNDGASGFVEEVSQQQEEERVQGEKREVPDLKVIQLCLTKSRNKAHDRLGTPETSFSGRRTRTARRVRRSKFVVAPPVGNMVMNLNNHTETPP